MFCIEFLIQIYMGIKYLIRDKSIFFAEGGGVIRGRLSLNVKNLFCYSIYPKYPIDAALVTKSTIILNVYIPCQQVLRLIPRNKD